MSDELKKIADALEAPFDPKEIKWKPQAVKDGRALAVAYIDARVVAERLDEVLGINGWSDSYTVLPGGCVECKLACVIGSREVTRSDVGSPSEQPDAHDKVKAAYSDALKRAAVKFGVGRYLYRLPLQWVPYDAQKRRFAQTPGLPAWAIPAGAKQAPPPPPPKTSPPPAQTPAPRPAARVPSVPPPDPMELIGKPQIEALTKLLYAKKKTWPQARRWLTQAHGFSPAAAITDLTFQTYELLTAALNGQNQTQPARAS